MRHRRHCYVFSRGIVYRSLAVKWTYSPCVTSGHTSVQRHKSFFVGPMWISLWISSVDMTLKATGTLKKAGIRVQRPHECGLVAIRGNSGKKRSLVPGECSGSRRFVFPGEWTLEASASRHLFNYPYYGLYRYSE